MKLVIVKNQGVCMSNYRSPNIIKTHGTSPHVLRNTCWRALL